MKQRSILLVIVLFSSTLCPYALGQTLDYSTFLGGSKADGLAGKGIAIHAGSMIVTSITYSSDFPATILSSLSSPPPNGGPTRIPVSSHPRP